MDSPKTDSQQDPLHKILVVDDEVDNLDLLKRTFRRQYEVLTANGGKEALDILDQNEVALIISDQRMPEMTGVELFEKSRDKFPNAIRILLTGYTDVNALVDAINMGHVYRYITKPWSREEIVLTVRRAIEHYDATKRNLELVEELRVQNEKLEESNRELKRLDELKTKFMVISSHELRTPASIISGNLELLLSGAMGTIEAECREVVENAYKGTSRLIDLIEDVLSVIRIDHHQLELRRVDFKLAELVGNVIDEYKVFIQERKQTIVNSIDPSVIINADKNRMVQVFSNLLGNAMKFTEDEGKIEFNSESLGNGRVKVTVVDNGIGIPKEELEKIFGRFYQLGDSEQHRTSKTKFMGGGTGLGLTIARGIIEDHGGKLWAESDSASKGSRFYIEMPCID